jgi:hypothetical protein
VGGAFFAGAVRADDGGDKQFFCCESARFVFFS